MHCMENANQENGLVYNNNLRMIKIDLTNGPTIRWPIGKAIITI